MSGALVRGNASFGGIVTGRRGDAVRALILGVHLV
jgi:hypothetical protein